MERKHTYDRTEINRTFERHVSGRKSKSDESGDRRIFNGEIVVTGPMADKGFTEDNVNLAGSVIGSMGAETLKSIQKNYMEKHPHHIPLLFMLDVINGYKTVFQFRLRRSFL